MALSPELVRWDIVDTHIDEAAFLFEQWLAALESPGYTFERFAQGVERRLLAHLDALAVGESAVADRVLLPSITQECEAPTTATVAALSLLIAPDSKMLKALIRLLVELPPGPAQSGVERALARSPRLDISAQVLAVAEGGSDLARLRLLAVVAERGGLPGPEVTRWTQRATAAVDASERLVAAKLAPLYPRVQALHLAEHLLEDTDPIVRVAALDSSLALGSAGAYGRAADVVRGRLSVDEAMLRASMEWLAVAGEPAGVETLLAQLDDTGRRASAIWALGFCGRVQAVDRLLPLLEDEAVGPLAAEAITGIAGIGSDDRECWRDAPPTPAPNEDDLAAPVPDEDLDTDIASTPAGDLPIPEAAVFAARWRTLRVGLDARARLARGRPLLHADDYLQLLLSSSLRRRHVIAREIAMRSRGIVRVATRAFTGLQRTQLDALRGMGAVDGSRPYARIS